MDTINNEVQQTKSKASTGIALGTIALLLSILALFIGVGAYNKDDGEDIQDVVVTTTQEAVDQVEVAADQLEEEASEIARETQMAVVRADAETRLLVVRSQIETNESNEETVREIENVREELADAYSDSEDDVKSMVDDINTNLELLESQILTNTEDALDNLSNVLATLRDDRLSVNDN